VFLTLTPEAIALGKINAFKYVHNGFAKQQKGIHTLDFFKATTP
jgi:hypothetical protein